MEVGRRGNTSSPSPSAIETRRSFTVIVSPLIFVDGMTLAAQDRFTVTSPNGIAFSEFKGCDAWRKSPRGSPRLTRRGANSWRVTLGTTKQLTFMQ